MYRAVSVVVALAPIAAHLASLTRALTRGAVDRPAGLVFVVLASLVAAMNFYLAFVRPILETRAAERENRRSRKVSVAPMIGTAFAAAGAVFGYGSLVCAILGLTALALDTGGFPWFVVCTWRDPSL